MKKAIALLGTILTLALAGTAGAALVPGVFDPGTPAAPSPPCRAASCISRRTARPTTNAAAGADITGLAGQAFTSAAFTLASAGPVQRRLAAVRHRHRRRDVLPRLQQRHAGHERRWHRDLHVHGRHAARGGPAGADADRDDQLRRRADRRPGRCRPDQHLGQRHRRGLRSSPAPTTKDDCKKGGWKTFTDPKFKNQGQCVCVREPPERTRASTAERRSGEPRKPAKPRATGSNALGRARPRPRPGPRLS